jgi:hypothetical protein
MNVFKVSELREDIGAVLRLLKGEDNEAATVSTADAESSGQPSLGDKLKVCKIIYQSSVP